MSSRTSKSGAPSPIKAAKYSRVRAQPARDDAPSAADQYRAGRNQALVELSQQLGITAAVVEV